LAIWNFFVCIFSMHPVIKLEKITNWTNTHAYLTFHTLFMRKYCWLVLTMYHIKEYVLYLIFMQNCAIEIKKKNQYRKNSFYIKEYETSTTTVKGSMHVMYEWTWDSSITLDSTFGIDYETWYKKKLIVWIIFLILRSENPCSSILYGKYDIHYLFQDPSSTNKFHELEQA